MPRAGRPTRAAAALEDASQSAFAPRRSGAAFRERSPGAAFSLTGAFVARRTGGSELIRGETGILPV